MKIWRMLYRFKARSTGSSYRNENSPVSQQIIVRIDNENNNACVGLGYHITLIVNPLPEFDLEKHQILCFEPTS